VTAMRAQPDDETISAPAPVAAPVAAPVLVVPETPTPGVPTPGVVAPEVVAAEAKWWRGLVIGIAIGMPVCALLWMGLVALALAVAEPGWPVWPAVAMAAVVGVFAGAFLGGWGGVTACAEALDEAELHASRHR
jgi:hypothetical protein